MHSSSPVRIIRLHLTNFRNHRDFSFQPEAPVIALIGPNGSGKTNVLEAISFLTPGRGLRRTPLEHIPRADGPGDWAVRAHVHTHQGTRILAIGKNHRDPNQTARELRIDQQPVKSLNSLAGICPVIWMTPSMNTLFTDSASERRRFLDQLVTSFDPGHKARLAAFKAITRQRNSILERDRYDTHWLNAVEAQMAEHAVSIAAARCDMVSALRETIEKKQEASPFPAPYVAISGTLEDQLVQMPALAVEDRYCEILRSQRQVDALCKQTRTGPHRSDLIVHHPHTRQPASQCSTGEQKIILVSMILAYVRTTASHRTATHPVLMFDEVAAHLDTHYRTQLFHQLISLGVQTWLTATESQFFPESKEIQIRHINAPSSLTSRPDTR